MRSGLIFVTFHSGMRGADWDRFALRSCRKYWAQLAMPRDAFIHERFTRDTKTASGVVFIALASGPKGCRRRY
jgi:hypothetical protein